MLTQWNKLLNTDCKVYELGDNFVYPIMRNGSTSLSKVVGREYTNHEIDECQNILVFLRDPADRFISGINEYCQQRKADLRQIYRLVEQGKLIDRHFSPQWIWLLHLSKYYEGMISLVSFKDIGSYCRIHSNKSKNKITNIEPLSNFIKADHELMKHLGKTVNIKLLMRKCKNALSKD
jgi:hypothetical protein